MKIKLLALSPALFLLASCACTKPKPRDRYVGKLYDEKFTNHSSTEFVHSTDEGLIFYSVELDCVKKGHAAEYRQDYDKLDHVMHMRFTNLDDLEYFSQFYNCGDEYLVGHVKMFEETGIGTENYIRDFMGYFVRIPFDEAAKIYQEKSARRHQR